MQTMTGAWILSVDDDPEMLAMTQFLFGQAGYRVSAFSNGREALAALESGSVTPDLILLDLQMPDLDGYAICRRLQANPSWSLIPVVFLTADSTSNNRLHAFQMGAVGFLDKMLDSDQILLQIQKFMRVRQAWLKAFFPSNQDPDTLSAPEDSNPRKDFAGFKRFFNAQTGKSLPDSAQPTRIYALAAGLGLSPAQMARLIAAYCQLDYLDILDASKVKLGILPLAFCLRHQLVPIIDDEQTSLVLSNPFDIELSDHLQRFDFQHRFLAEPSKIRALCGGQSIMPDNHCVWSPGSARRP